MVVLWRKTRVSSIIYSLLLTLLFLLGSLWLVASTLTASTAQAAQAHRYAGILTRGDTPQQHIPDPDTQLNSQNLQAPHNRSINAVTVGNNQANSGNQGENNGFNQDSSANLGNAINSQHKAIQLQENNQTLHNANSGESETNISNIGSDQGNSGNQGFNAGFNQDNANNSGNQVNNQGTTIGTQINNQGSEVNNNGSIIQHQINYISLLPNIQLHLDATRHPQLSLNVH